VGQIQQSIAHLADPAVLSSAALLRTSRRPRIGIAAPRDDATALGLLTARYPVIRRLVGADSFGAMARRFIAAEPPGLAPLPRYGDTFPRFLRSQDRTASIEYVADIAELELARGKARVAAQARPVAARVFHQPVERLARSRVVLHPSVFLVASRFPIVTIWENNRSNGEGAMIARWRAERALVSRPFLKVEVRRLAPGGYAFIHALSLGETVASAATIAAAADFDLDCGLSLLSEANVVIGFREDG
jgi:Putative DNA-binding domain